MWFHVDQIRHETELGVVTIKLTWDSWRLPVSGVLSIYHVKFLHIKDTEHIGWYPIGNIKVAYDRKTIQIRGEIPIDIYIVSDVSIRTKLLIVDNK